MSAARFRLRLTPALGFIFLSTVYCNICPQNCVCYLSRYECVSTTNVNEIFIQLTQFFMQISCKNSTLSINCSDLPHTSRQFPKIDVSKCHTSILTCISKSHGLNQPWMEHMVLHRIHGTLRKEYVEDLKFLKSILWYLDADSPVPVTLINSLENIKLIELCGGKLQLSSDKFNSTSLQELFFTYTNMDNLNSGAFQGLPNLNALHLTDVQIEDVRAGFLSGLHLLRTLVLTNNNLKSIEEGVFISTPYLQDLVIRSNPLISISDQLMAGLNFLKVLVIKRPNGYLNGTDLKIAFDAFSGLNALETVTIKYCTANKKRHEDWEKSTKGTVTAPSIAGNWKNFVSPMKFENLKSLKYAVISGSCVAEISNVMFGNITTLQQLDLSDNMIKELPKNIFCSLFVLKYLDLSKNYIKVLDDGLFSNLTALQTLKLSENAIEMLTFDVFIGLENLTGLYLQNNNIMTIESSYHSDQSPFRHLSKLKYMDLSNNKISIILGSLASEMPHIQYLNVSSNDMDDIRDFEDFYSKKNIVIDLSNNKISYLHPFAGVHSLSYTNDSQLSNCIIKLEHNPVICDCKNYELYLHSKGIEEHDKPRFVLGYSRCSNPPKLKGKIITELSATDIVCDLEDGDGGCPLNCTCTLIPATETAIVNCNEMPTELGGDVLFTLHLKTQPSSLLENVRAVNLSNTALHSVTFNVTDNLKVLDVSHNNLHTLPDTFLKANITLYIADNPLECDCSLVQGLKEYRVADYDLVHCADGTELSKINLQRLCMWKTLLMGYICMGIIAGIFLFKCGLTTYKDMKRKRMNISTFLFRRGSNYSINMEMVHDITKDNDLFISFAHEDSEFVRDHLLPKLENEFQQKVCVHHRDWVPGELIEDQIVQSVESSRRTMIILTEAFILSEWSYLEFRTAHNMSIREGRPRVIIIVLEESIVNDERLSREIKSYTSVNTYLVWGDPNFWQKLKRILPKRRR